MKKKLTFLLICPLWPGGGLKPLADISAKNVSFFDVSPQQSEGVAQIRSEACKNKKMPFPKKTFSLCGYVYKCRRIFRLENWIFAVKNCIYAFLC